MLRPDVVAVESFGRTSGVQAFLTTMRSWGLASCMCVEGVAQVGLVVLFAVEGLLGTWLLCTMRRLRTGVVVVGSISRSSGDAIVLVGVQLVELCGLHVRRGGGGAYFA